MNISVWLFYWLLFVRTAESSRTKVISSPLQCKCIQAAAISDNNKQLQATANIQLTYNAHLASVIARNALAHTQTNTCRGQVLLLLIIGTFAGLFGYAANHLHTLNRFGREVSRILDASEPRTRRTFYSPR